MIITSIEQLDLTKQYTYADYLAWQIEERLELIKGWVMRMAAPSVIHQRVLRRITGKFEVFFIDKAPCEYYFAPFDVRLLNKTKSAKASKNIYTVVQPDLCVICDPNKLDSAGCIGAPDLVIEILSPGNTRKEMKEKYEVYEESGVREYWIAHPLEKYVLVYYLDKNNKFVALPYFIEDDIVKSVIFPELVIDLKDIFKNI